MQIKQEYIDRSEELLLPEGCHFDDERVSFIRRMESGDLLAVPGSGKTTALRAKLYCMAQNLPLNEGRGILAISHTNVAVEELKNKLQHHCPQLFEYPNFVGTIQDFVDTFLALPYYIQRYGHKVDVVDADRYEQLCEIKMKYASGYLKSKIPYYKSIRYGFNDNGEEILLSGLNGEELHYPIANSWRRLGTVDDEVAKMRNTMERMKSSLMEEGVLHFDDCYHLADAYIRTCPDILNILRKRFAYVFVDEAQDMQKHQLEVIDRVFNCDGVVLQRIGDPNQSIFDGFSAQNRWVSRNPTYINNSMRLTSEVASIVDHLVLDRGDDGNGTHFVVNGLRTLDEPIAPYLILYAPDTMSRLKEKFREIIRRHHLPQLPDAKENGFHIIGWNAERSENVNYKHLEDIFPEYQKKLNNPNSVPDTLSELLQNEKYIGSFDTSKKVILEGFALVLRKNRLRAADGRQYTPSKILTLIGEQIETERQQFKEELFVGTKLLSQGKWGETYISLKRLYSKWLSDLFATEPNDEVKTFFGTAFVQQLVGHDEHDEPEEIPISISTVHSAKGMTHCATMYVETAHRNKYESQYMIEPISTGRGRNRVTTYRSPFFKQDVVTDRPVKSTVKRIMYVGFSRPTHLLCYASNRDLWNEELIRQMRENGWVIENA